MILTDGEIIYALMEGHLKIDPFDETYLQPASYDIHLHGDLLVPGTRTNTVIIPDKTDGNSFWSQIKLPYVLYPERVALGRSIERFAFPHDMLGRLEGCSTLGRWFLQVHITAGFFDPCFEGTATIEIKNQGPFPIELSAKMRIGQMAFERTAQPSIQTYGRKNRYFGQIAPTPPKAAP